MSKNNFYNYHSDQKIVNQSQIHMLTFTVTDWIDVFSHKRYRDILIDALQYCQQNKDMRLFAFVIMSNGMQLVVQSKRGDLSGLIRDYKKFTSITILAMIPEQKDKRADWLLKRFEFAAKGTSANEIYKLWARGNQPIELCSKEMILKKINEIHQLPVLAGIVHHSADYIYSSATNYAGTKSIVELEKFQ